MLLKNKTKIERRIMSLLTLKDSRSYNCIDELRFLNNKIKSYGIKGFRPTEVLSEIRSRKMEIENDSLLEDYEVDGASIKIINCGKCITFEYLSEDIVIRKIQAANDESKGGVLWTKEQKTIRKVRFNEIKSSMGRSFL